MKRPISRKAHGFAEWAYIPLTALSPELMNFKGADRPRSFARIMSGLMLGSALLTRSEWGIFKLLPFKGHLFGDVAISTFSLAAPWLGNFSRNAAARNTFLFIGLTGLLIGGFLTQRTEMAGSR
jgi:hypothetical protein